MLLIRCNVYVNISNQVIEGEEKLIDFTYKIDQNLILQKVLNFCENLQITILTGKIILSLSKKI